MYDDDNWTGYKNPPSAYRDWYTFNPPSGQKQSGRFETDMLACKNPSCPSSGRGVSEAEAFYHWSKQGFFARLKKMNTMAICPFCGGNDLRPFLDLPLFNKQVNIKR
jgi:hypothetical protein